MGWTGDAIAGTPWFQRRKYLGMRMQQNNLQKEAGHLPTLMSVNHQSQHIQAFASKCNMFETQQQSHLIVPNNYMTSHLSFFYLKNFFTQNNLSHLWLYNDHHIPFSQDFHPTTQAHPPTPQTISSGDHKFFNVCESASVLQRNSVCPFFRFHMSVKAFGVGVSLYG